MHTVLDRLVKVEADDIRTCRAGGKLALLRGYAETRYAAQCWARGVVALEEGPVSALSIEMMLNWREASSLTFVRRSTINHSIAPPRE
jgi:hypothetical protein